MPVFTDVSSAEIRRTTTRLYGTLTTRPQILVSDGLNDAWAADVNIGPTDPSGNIQQYLNKKNGKSESNLDLITGLPLQKPEDWQLDDSLPASTTGKGGIDTTMHNVVIARNSLDLIYADVGAPVICERSESGQWQIVGFSMERPEEHHLYPVDLGDMTLGTVIDLSVATRLLTLAEMGETQPVEYPFGSLPFGASAIYQGGVLLRIV